MVYVGIDLGGTSIKAGLVDEQGKILCKATCPTLVERGARWTTWRSCLWK